MIITGMILQKAFSQDRHVPGCGDLTRIRKARGIPERGARHAKRVSLGGHERRKARFRHAQPFCDHDGHIIGGLGDKR